MEKYKPTRQEWMSVYQMIGQHACPGCGCDVTTTYVTINSATLTPFRVDCECWATLVWTPDGYLYV